MELDENLEIVSWSGVFVCVSCGKSLPVASAAPDAPVLKLV